MIRRVAGVLMTGALLVALVPGSAAAVDPPDRSSAPLPDTISRLKLDQPITLTGEEAAAKVDKTIRAGRTQQRVVVRLSAPPAVELTASGAATQKAALRTARLQQDAVIALARKLDSKVKVLGRTGKASNLVMLKIDAADLAALAKDPTVVSIKPVRDYTLDLSETVRYVGASKVQAKGYKGAGVDVAILDSGTDYTHAALGGAGTLAAFTAAYGTGTGDARNTTLDGLFPTARVKGGYDFVGEGWPDTDEAPDPDPIDSPDSGTALGVAYGTDGGHGTHVADIIGGTLGVAPMANLYSVKVCSSISTSCSGVALLQAVDWAMDPNGDGNLADHVDIINMSLGSDYGTVQDDDLTAGRRASQLLRRNPGRGIGRQRGQQAVHRRHPGRGPGRPLGRPDAGPERGGLPARHHGAGGDRRHVRQHGDRGVGSDWRRLQRRRGLRRAATAARAPPRTPRRAP